jgi:hypothetical protein
MTSRLQSGGSATRWPAADTRLLPAPLPGRRSAPRGQPSPERRGALSPVRERGSRIGDGPVFGPLDLLVTTDAMAVLPLPFGRARFRHRRMRGSGGNETAPTIPRVDRFSRLRRRCRLRGSIHLVGHAPARACPQRRLISAIVLSALAGWTLIAVAVAIPDRVPGMPRCGGRWRGPKVIARPERHVSPQAVRTGRSGSKNGGWIDGNARNWARGSPR